jgi:uncharacterized protein (TIGR02265 family)
MSDQKVKGSILKSRLAFVREQAGEEALRKVIASLPAEDQRALNGIVPVAWLPFELGKRLDEAIVQVVGGGSLSYFERLGEASAEKNLGTVHAAFLAPGDPHAFLAKAPQIYRMYYQVGRREYERVGEREALLTTHDAETFSKPDCLTVIGWYKKALEMCGAKNPRIYEEECRASGGSACRYRVTWQ